MLDIIRRRGSLALAVLLAGGLVAACGSGSSSSTTSTTAAASSSAGGGGSGATANAAGSGATAGARRTALRNCLKAHGVTLPARPPAGAAGAGRTPYGGGPPAGRAPGFGGGGVFRSNPKVRAALQACGANFGARRFQLSHQAINRYVACIRQHGYNMPNPNFSGNGPVFPASIRSNPKFQAASRACQNLLVPPRPGGGTRTTTTSASA